jgi:hypothetical protein
MANLFVNLPVSAADGVGAGQDTSAMGRQKTFTIQASFTGTVTIEISNDAGATWASLRSYTTPSQETIDVACQQIRVRRSGTSPVPGLPNVDVASDNIGTLFVLPAVPAADGTGAGSNVAPFGSFSTIIVTGVFTGVVIVQISEDNVVWADAALFTTPDAQSVDLFMQFVRVVRRGTGAAPGTPVVAIGSVNDPVADRYDYPASFAGPGATTATEDDVVRVNPTGGAVTVNLPLVSLNNLGQTIIVKNTTADLTAITIDPSGAQTVDGAATLVMTTAFASRVLVSDGVSNWNVVGGFA